MAFGGVTNPIAGIGTELQRGDGELVEVFSAIGQVTNIEGPAFEREVIDATTIQSVNRFDEVILGTIRTSPVNFAINWMPKNGLHSDLYQDLVTGVLRNFRLVIPDGENSEDNDAGLNSLFEFSAYVVGFQPRVALDDRITASLSLKITGEPTLTT